MTNPNTNPEQIVDKNGKVTTVHKLIGKPTTPGTGSSRAASVTPAPLIFVSREERIEQLTLSTAGRAVQSAEPVAALRKAFDTLQGVITTSVRQEVLRALPSLNPSVVKAEIYMDGDGFYKLEGAFDRNEHKVPFQSKDDEDVFGYCVIRIARSGEEKGKRFIVPNEVNLGTTDEFTPEAREMFSYNTDLMNYIDAREIAAGVGQALEREARKDLGQRLRAIDPNIDGISYHENGDARGRDGKQYHIRFENVVIGGELVYLGRYKNVLAVAEVFDTFNVDNLVTNFGVGDRGVINF